MDQRTGQVEPFEDEFESSRYDESIPYTDPRWNVDYFVSIPGIRKWRYSPGGGLTTNLPIENVTQILDKESETYYGYKYFVAESVRKNAALFIAKLFDQSATEVEYYDNPY